MKLKNIKAIETPYSGIKEKEYQIEKRRLQVELLRIQQRMVKEKQRIVVVFEGRDAAGKGSTIKRFTENLIPAHSNIIALGVPTEKESKYWFRRYEQHVPQKGEIIFFDRSWYTRALIEPTMEYCTKKQYKYFMKKVLTWEEKLIDEGVLLIKFYLSVSQDTQLLRFDDRLNNPLTHWKFSENDLKARKKWAKFTHYKEQMFSHTSSPKSPWVIVNANSKKEARLTSMLHFVRLLGNKNFDVLSGEDVTKTHSIEVGGIKFRGLSLRQLAVLEELKEQECYFVGLQEKII
jgi:polyphosphate kinase 2